MNALTRFDTTALNKALIGFDRLFDNIETRFQNQQNYPPYNVVKIDENNYNIVIAVAGFGKDEITVEVDQDQLIIKGEKAQTDEGEYLHRGLALRDFNRSFTLAEHMEVKGADIKDGLLSIKIERIVPEALKPRRISVTEIR